MDYPTRDIRGLLAQSGDSGAILNRSSQAANQVAQSVPDSSTGSQILELLKRYQQFGTNTQISAEKEQANRLTQQTPNELIGASPSVQNAVRTADVSAIQPTIGGAKDVAQSFKNVIDEFNKTIDKERDDARAVVKDGLTAFGSKAIDIISPEIFKKAGYTPDKLKLIGDTLKQQEMAIREQIAEARRQSSLANPLSPQNQAKYEQQYRQVLTRALSVRTSGAGLEDAKINQANHLKAVFDQYYDPKTGRWNIPNVLYNELALGLARLISPNGQVGSEIQKSVTQSTARGDLGKALTYLLGTPVTGTTQAVLQIMKDSIDRQGLVAEQNRTEELSHFQGLVPTDLDPARAQALERHLLKSYGNSPSSSVKTGQTKSGLKYTIEP